MNDLTIQMTQQRTTLVDTINTFGQQLKGFVRKRVRSAEDAEDIVQDIWYQLSALTDLESIENIGAWLYTTARNRIIDKFKKKQTGLLEDMVKSDGEEEWSVTDWIAATDGLPDDHYMKKIFWELLYTSLEELPEKQKSVYIKNELQDLSLQEIADESGESIKTIISRKRYAVNHLQSRLREFYQDYMTSNS